MFWTVLYWFAVKWKHTQFNDKMRAISKPLIDNRIFYFYFSSKCKNVKHFIHTLHVVKWLDFNKEKFQFEMATTIVKYKPISRIFQERWFASHSITSINGKILFLIWCAYHFQFEHLQLSSHVAIDTSTIFILRFVEVQT